MKTVQVRKNAFLMLGAVVFVSLALSGCLKEAKSSVAAPKTYLSLMHLAPWAPPVEVFFDNSPASSAINPGIVSNSYSALDPGMFSVNFKKSGKDSVVASLGSSLYDSSKYYTLLLYNIDTLHVRAVRILDDFSNLTPDKSFFRFFHMSPEIGDVDVYFDNTRVVAGRSYADNTFSNNFNQFTEIGPSTYTVSVKLAGTDSVIATTPSVYLTQFNAYTIYLRGRKGGTGVNAIGVDYLQAAD